MVKRRLFADGTLLLTAGRDRQNSCPRPEVERQGEGRPGGVGQENPGCFSGLYEMYVKPWRKRKIKAESSPKAAPEADNLIPDTKPR